MICRIALFLLLFTSTAGFAAKKAPDFTLPDTDGGKFKLSEALKKGPVLIDFWATWCKPCIQELPYISELDKRHGEKGLQVVTITIDSPKSQSKVKPFVKGSGYNFRVLLDGDMEVRKLFGGKDIPLTILISQSGTIEFMHIGYSPGNEKELFKVVDSFMAKSSAPAPEPSKE
jgi:peroxiredoxin